MHKQARNAWIVFFWDLQGVCKDDCSFEYSCWQFCSFTRLFPPQTAKSKTAKSILPRSILPSKTAKSKMDLAVLLLAVLLWVKRTRVKGTWQFYYWQSKTVKSNAKHVSDVEKI